MGEKILKYFNFIGKINGFEGKIKLSQKIKIPITQAALMPDLPEYSTAFKRAILELTGQNVPDFLKNESLN